GVLANQPGPARDIVALNAGVALYAANVAPTMGAGLQMAQHAIESGAALAKLNELVSFGAAATSGAV
ncbi:MAG: anthranilate phosphoribosyltransferase, partial [Pseudomonadota bacterium]